MLLKKLLSYTTFILLLLSLGCKTTKGPISNIPESSPSPPPLVEAPAVPEIPENKATKIKSPLEDKIAKSKVFEKSFTGFMLYDPKEEAVLYEYEADKYFTPASNIKILTLYTSLSILGDSIPSLKYVIRGDSLIFWGTGDPTFLHPQFEKNSVVLDFLKGRKETLYFAASNFKDQRYGPGWAWDDYFYNFQAEKASLPIHGNQVRIIRRGNSNRFETFPPHFQNNINYNPALRSDRSFVRRKEEENVFEYNHIRANYDVQLPFKTSDELTLQLLSDYLGKSVQAYPYQTLAPEDAQLIFGADAQAIYERLMQKSDNFVAEQLMLLCSEKLFREQHVGKAIKYASDSLFAQLEHRLVWRDGSGLSRYNLVTPTSMVEALDLLYNTVPFERLKSIFPKGGHAGLLKKNQPVEDAYVFAKTGSMSNKNCLSGYLITERKTVLIFSFMHNNYVDGSSVIKKEMREVLKFIYKNY